MRPAGAAWSAPDQSLFGAEWPESIGGFLAEVFTTAHGWTLIILGNAVGFLFAVLILTISVVSFATSAR